MIMEKRPGRLAVYVTSHGFGHLNRTAAVLNRVPAEVPVTIRSHSNLFEHWRERLKRPAELEHYVADVGAVNPPGDSAATDPVATLELAVPFHADVMARLGDQVQKLQEDGTAAVLCDAPAVPLVAARRGRSGFPHEQLHLGRYLRSLCTRGRRRGGPLRRRFASVLPAGHGDVPGRAGHAHVLDVTLDRIGHGREPGSRSRRRAALPLRPEGDRQAGVSLSGPLWTKRPRLVAPAGDSSRGASISSPISPRPAGSPKTYTLFRRRHGPGAT